MTLLELSSSGGALALRDVAEVAVALLLGLLSWQGKRLTGKVDSTAAILDKWSGVLFGPTGQEGMYGDVQELKTRLDRRGQSPDEVGMYDRRSHLRDEIEREKEDRRRELLRLTPHPTEG